MLDKQHKVGESFSSSIIEQDIRLCHRHKSVIHHLQAHDQITKKPGSSCKYTKCMSMLLIYAVYLQIRIQLICRGKKNYRRTGHQRGCATCQIFYMTVPVPQIHKLIKLTVHIHHTTHDIIIIYITEDREKLYLCGIKVYNKP